MTDPALIERITRSLAYMLRHQPHEFDLELDAHGYGGVDEVVRALNERLGEPVERPDLEAAIVAGDRPRYEIVGEKVRALYGHSIPVEPGEPGQPPELLYVGLGARDAERALEHGLSGGRRRFLHLARSVDDARESGRRAGREYAVLVVRATEAWEEGVNFYDRHALFLSEAIPTRFIGLHARYQDGEDRHTSERGGWAPRQDDRGPRDGEPRRDSHDDAPRAPRGEFDRGGPRGGDRGRRGRGRGRGRGGDREQRPVHAGGDSFRDERRPAAREEGRDVRPDEPRRESFVRDDESRREARGGPRDEPRREELRRDEPRRGEPRRDEFRRDEPRREDARRDAPRRDEPRRDEPRRDEPRRDDRSRERFDRPERHGDRDRGHQRGGDRGFEPRSDRPAAQAGGHGGGRDGGRGEM
ncbi:MAG: RNA 2'-phosphotransferase, partial [Planctomycetes bacterium]|nr:RNA 2'-phosphotransferase [Planctomycetota bacterium]